MKNILYNEYYNDNINSDFRLNMNTTLLSFDSNMEIVVYESDIIKHYTATYPILSSRIPPDTFEELDAEMTILIIEYDENGNEILHRLFSDDYLQLYVIENVRLDSNNNWVEQNVYWHREDEVTLVEIFTRVIEYVP